MIINIQHSLLAVAAACIGLSAQAQSTSPVVIRGTTSVKDLQVQLTDLRTGDGVVPSFTRSSPGGIQAEVYAGASDGSYEPVKNESNWVEARGTLLDPIKFDLTLGNGEASLSKLGGELSLDLAVQASSFGSSVYGYNGYFELPSGGGRYGASYSTRDNGHWSLGAGTEVKISGTVYIDLHVDTNPVVGLTQGQVLDVAAWVNGSIGLLLPYNATYTDVLGGQSYQIRNFAGDVTQRVSPQGSGSSINSNDVQAIPFELIARNQGTSAVDLEFGASFTSDGRWDLAQDRITSVPEPGAWGLGLAGLLTLGARTKRRRRA